MVDERHRDYVLPVSAIPAGGVLTAQNFQLDFDAPFVLSEVGVTLDYTVPSILLKFTDPNGRFVEQDFTPFAGEIPYSGSAIPVLTPIYPNLVYPLGGNIRYDISNTNPNTDIDTGDINLTFRGRSLHPPQSVMNRDAYPKYFREIPHSYVFPITVATSPQLNNPLQIQPDADFVARALVIGKGNYNSPLTNQFSFQFKDQMGQFYQKQMTQISQIASSKSPQRPGVFVPEIYIKRNSLIYVDILRNSGPALPQTLYLRLVGSKIFPSTSPC